MNDDAIDIAAHVVAAGVTTEAELRAVVVLVPRRRAGPRDAAAEARALVAWPSLAHGRLRDLTEIRAKPAGGGQVDVESWPIKEKGATPKNAFEALNALWSRLMVESTADWTTLLDAWDGTAPAPATVPAAVPLPTAEAGLAVPLERARGVLEALAAPGSPLLARAPTRPPAAALSALGRPWLGEPGATERFAALHRDLLADAGRDRLFGPPDVSEWISARGRKDRAARRVGDLAYARSLDPMVLARDALGLDGRDMLEVFDRMHALHHAVVAGTELAQAPAQRQGQPTPDEMARNRARRRLAQLMSSPSLLRLFGIARDVTLVPTGRRPKTGQTTYWELWPMGHHNGGGCATKLSLGPGATRGFYPCPRGEWPGAPARPAAGAVTERDGLVVLGSAPDGSPDHAIITLEPALAIESDYRAQRLFRDTAAEDAGDPVPTPLTGGLALVRLGVTDAEPSAREKDATRFSEDLRAFDRLDVGIVLEGRPGEPSPTGWRCVQHRRLVWGDPARPAPGGPGEALRGIRRGWIEEVLHAVTAGTGALARHEMDAASCTPAKIAVPGPKPPPRPDDDEETRKAAEAPPPIIYCSDRRVGIYDGTPGGAAANEPWWDGRERCYRWDPREVTVDRPDGLALDQFISLPARDEEGPAAALPPLRFGWRYRMGLRRVWLGGVARPLAEAAALYGSDPAACIPPPAEDGRLFLRHEPIAAPVVALPSWVPALGPDSPHEDTLQSAEGAVVVSWRGPPPSGHRTLRSTSRVLLVPPVSLEFAALHGVFDDGPDVRSDRILLTAPARRPRTAQGVPESASEELPPPLPPQEAELEIRVPRDMLRRLDLRGKVDPAPTGRDPAKVRQDARAGEPLRLQVLAADSVPSEHRPAPYYPDPAAAYLAIGLREVSGDAWAEKPRLVRLRGDDGAFQGHFWPNILPVHVELETAPPGTRSLRVAPAPILLPPAPPGAPQGSHFQSVTVALGRGEKVLLQAWLVPSLDDIAEWFDICGTAAQLAMAEGGRRLPGNVPDQERCRRGLDELLGPSACAPLLGSGGPGMEEDARRQVASLLWARLLEGPVEAISKVRSISMLHAVRDPAEVPAPHAAEPFALTRRRDTSTAAVAAFLAGGTTAVGDEDGALQSVLSGGVRLDLATTSGVLVEALVAVPDGALDETPPPTSPGLVPLLPQSPRWLDPEGNVTTPAERAVEILRVEGIPAPVGDAPRLREVSLGALQRAAAAGTVPGLKAIIGAPFANGGARRARLRVTALPRHAATLLTPDEAAAAQDTAAPMRWTMEKGATLWLNATIPPAAPDPKELLPSFRWQETHPAAAEAEPLVWTKTREVGLRLTLRRPWFTSGEGEELGIILWPPPSPLGSTGGLGPEPDDSTLAALVEEDIGPLGPFVSAWARDPIRDPEAAGAPRHVPLRREHFDLSSLGPNPWEDRVLIPIAGGSLAEGLEEEAATSILRLVPRLDHSAEPATAERNTDQDRRGEILWAADIAFAPWALRRLTDRFVRLGLVRFQPHARADRTIGGGRRSIRCSAPAVAWTVMPPRRVVTVTALDAGDGATYLTVRLAGPGDAPRAGLRPGTAVRMTVLHARGGRETVARDSSGAPLEADTLPRLDDAPPPLVVVGTTSEGDRTWTTVFRLPVRGEAALREHSVVVEESDALPEADRDSPPGPGEPPLVRAGTRFFARIDLVARRR